MFHATACKMTGGNNPGLLNSLIKALQATPTEEEEKIRRKS